MSAVGSARTPPPVPRRGDRVGTFEIVAELGHGGMGVVYRARDTVLEREVALKRPKPEFAEKPEFCRRFLDEARAASKLNHPNITTVFEAFEEDGVPWMAMELVDGNSLRDVVSRDDRMSVEQILLHAQGLADALESAHSCGVLHRDINPNNVLVGHDGRARLSDFGLARILVASDAGKVSSKASTEPRETDRGAGTRGYMSPEQALGRKLDGRSDVFNLGLVVYEMCTGEAAFGETDSQAWLDALLHREPQPATKLNHEIPDELERIMSKAISKRLDERYQSARDMLADISALRRRVESDTDASPLPTRQTLRRARSRRGLTGAAIAAAILAAAVTVWRVVDLPPGNVIMALPSTQLTTGSGWERQPAISPNGTFVTYTSDESGNADIWLINVAGDEPQQLTDHPASDTDPAWFPEGSAIAFVSDRTGEPSIWRIPVLGGSPTRLLEDAQDPALAPDGTRIAFSRAGASGMRRIGVAPVDDPSQARVLTEGQSGLWDHENPAWSADGHTLCYADFRDLWLVPTEGGQPRRLTTDHAGARDPVWSPDGRYIYFSSACGDAWSLWRLRVGDAQKQQITSGTGSEGEPSLSRDGSLLAYSTSDFNPDIVILDRGTGERSAITGAREDTNPALAPDGSRVAFASNRRGKFDLWLQALEGVRPVGAPIQLTDNPDSAVRPDFSPDGHWLAYQRVLDEQRDIWIIPVSGGAPQRFTDHAGVDIHAAFSPDGSRLAWVSDRDGAENVWVAAVANGHRVGEPHQVTSGESAHLFPTWSPDGARIAYVGESGHECEAWFVELEPGTPPTQVTRDAGACGVAWAAAEDELLVSGTWGTGTVTVRSVSLVDGSTRPLEPAIELGQEESDPAVGDFASGDGGRIVAYVAIESGGDVWLAEMDGERR